MLDELVRRAKLNALTGYIYFVLNALLTFVVSPMLVSYLGPFSFGVFKTCQRFLDFGTVADGRATQALKWIIANKESSSNSLEKRQALGSALGVVMYFLPAIFVVVVTLVYFLPKAINGVPENDYSLVRWVGLILGANVILNPLLGIPDAVLIGTNKGFLSTLCRSFWLVISNISMLVAAHLGFGLIGISIVILLVTVLNAVSVLWIANKTVLWFGFEKPEIDKVRKFFEFSIWILLWSFVAKLLLSSELLLIGYLVGAGTVTNYIFGTYIVQLGLAMSLLTGSAITPGLGKLLGSNDTLRSLQSVLIFREIILAMSIVICSFILVFNQSFVTLWVGEKYYMGNAVNALVSLSFFQLALIRCESQIQDLSLRIRPKVIFGFVGSVLGLLIGSLLYVWVAPKIECIFVGIILGRMCLSIQFPLMVNQLIESSSFSVSKYFYGGLIITTSYFVSQYIQWDSWPMFILGSGVVTGILMALTYFLILSPNCRTILTSNLGKW